MEVRIWKRYGSSTKTDSGESLWVCPVCGRGMHVCAMNMPKGKGLYYQCPDCKLPLKYPWEQ